MDATLLQVYELECYLRLYDVLNDAGMNEPQWRSKNVLPVTPIASLLARKPSLLTRQVFELLCSEFLSVLDRAAVRSIARLGRQDGVGLWSSCFPIPPVFNFFKGSQICQHFIPMPN
jgi:hypothetical protein